MIYLPDSVLKRAEEEIRLVKPGLTWALGAVLFSDDGEIVASGHSHFTINGILNLPVEYRKGIEGRVSVHAEAHALSKLLFKQKKTRGLNIYVAGRISKSRNFCKSKPCHICQGLLNYCRISGIWYRERDGKMVYYEQ